MSLRDRLRSKKETKKTEAQIESTSGELCEFKLSITKVTKAVNNIKNPADLGKIVKEFSKFLNTLASKNAKITFSGSFDLGQRTLLNCMLASFAEDEKMPVEQTTQADEEPQKAEEPPKEEPKLIRRRRSIKTKIEDEGSV